MLSTKNSILTGDLSKSYQEFLYQISECKYHLDNIRLSLQESVQHLKKYSHHVSLISELNKSFNIEVSNV